MLKAKLVAAPEGCEILSGLLCGPDGVSVFRRHPVEDGVVLVANTPFGVQADGRSSRYGTVDFSPRSPQRAGVV
jgi:hypothetical protein